MNVLVAQGLGMNVKCFHQFRIENVYFPVVIIVFWQIKRLANIITDKIAGHAVDRRINSC
jgi:hypothetical protein